MSQTSIAKAIATVAHRGQKYGGRPYRFHLRGVVAKVAFQTQSDDILVAAAWLHDVLEDTDITSFDLAQAGVAPRVIGLVSILTRGKSETYEDYIDQVSLDRDAVKIKLADLEFNLSHNPEEPLKARYRKARETLRASLV